MDEDEKYAFDTGGYVVLRQLLTPEEVDRCNAAIDAMTDYDTCVGSESYSSHEWQRGSQNLFNRLAKPIAALRPGTNAAAVARALHTAVKEEASPPAVRATITVGQLRAALERFELDDGWKLPPAQVENLVGTGGQLAREGFEPVGGRPHRVSEPEDSDLLSVGCSNWRIGGQLEWPQPHCEPFRELLCHPRLQPVLDVVLGQGHRLDHGPYVAIMRDGCDGHDLHGGAHERFSMKGGGFAEGYQFHAGHFFTGLTVVEVKLHDHRQGDGGLCVVPGSVRSQPAQSSHHHVSTD